MVVFSRLRQTPVLWGVPVSAIVLYWYARRRSRQSASDKNKADKNELQVHIAGFKKNRKVAVDRVFFKRLHKLLKIVIPGVFSAEMGYILLVLAILCARTYADLWMIETTTRVESIIISRNTKAFWPGLLRFIKYCLPVALVNNLLKYGLTECELRFRQRLTKNLYEHYLTNFTYYKIGNLDNRISNADQLLTEDVAKFCDGLVDCYSNTAKPLLDMYIYALKLTSSIGLQGPAYMVLYLIVSGSLLTHLRRPTASLTMREQVLEGEFRHVNSRLITNSEEIAFYQGDKKESQVLSGAFARLVEHMRKAMRFRFFMGMIDSCVAKYVATMVGFYVVSRPFLDHSHPRHQHSTPSELMEDYYQSGRMLMNLAGAIGRLVMAGRELTRLAGFTQRITQLQDVLADLNGNVYQRTMVGAEAVTNGDGSGQPRHGAEDGDNDDDDDDDAASRGKGKGKGDVTAADLGLKPFSGTIIEVDRQIKFERVPLVTPNGDVLVRALSFEVSSGMNTIVCGPNGCGKSSLFRTLGGLWPLFGGVLHKPRASELFYVPQRPYMTLGSLRDQVIYPHTHEDMKARGVTDDDLLKYLEDVKLSYLVKRGRGWDEVADWMDVLSGGEKQRVAMSRLFYHKPQFAILDECTSAVSIDVEAFMYEHCRDMDIALFTVSHRKTLWKHHEYVLYFDGRGNFEFARITPETEERISNMR